MLYKQTQRRERRGGRRRFRKRFWSSQTTRILSFSTRAFQCNLGQTGATSSPVISPKRRQARDSGGKVARCTGVYPGFLHGAGESSVSQARRPQDAEATGGWTCPAERGSPRAVCPAAQARYVIGKRRKRIPKRGRVLRLQLLEDTVDPRQLYLGLQTPRALVKIWQCHPLLPRLVRLHSVLLSTARATCPSPTSHTPCWMARNRWGSAQVCGRWDSSLPSNRVMHQRP